MDPRLKALYLAAIAVGVFFLPTWWWVGLVAGAQLGLWLGLGLGVRRLGRQLRKLALFLSVIVIAYALVGADPATDRWHTVRVLGLAIDVNLSGALAGVTMALRVIAVVLASQVARAGDPRALAAGLSRLGVPQAAALSIDAVLVLLGDEGGHRRGGRGGDGQGGGGGGRGQGGGGGGGGHGGGRGHGGGGGHGGRRRSWRGFWAGLGRLARGDVSLLVERMVRHIDRAERHLHDTADAAEPGGGRAAARDVAVIAGVALTMLGIKALKILPGIPFAPGHKGVILIPLYLAAGYLTRGRAGATLTGLTMGTVAFLLGDGRYGVFEICKHVAPGVLVDLGMPLMRAGGRERRAWAWSLFGLVVALGRYATVTAIALVVQAPAVVYAVLVPGLIVHAIFGVLSGLVAAPLMRALATRGATAAAPPADLDGDRGGESETQGDGS
ncbi:CbiQ family ECF transporter T component [Haliangium sp.]|uniref:CbiQ family ECF transporter T component n=1 Tax=Haliangium sp. TaxID=2663208 RepID=UPI003D0C007F